MADSRLAKCKRSPFKTLSFSSLTNHPNGAVSITEGNKGASDDVDGHTRVGGLLVHRPGDDRLIDLPDEPGHQALCDAEQAWIVEAIRNDTDLSRHMSDAVQSLRICLAADESIRSGKTIFLGETK